MFNIITHVAKNIHEQWATKHTFTELLKSDNKTQLYHYFNYEFNQWDKIKLTIMLNKKKEQLFKEMCKVCQNNLAITVSITRLGI